jgi:predicted transport protein
LRPIFDKLAQAALALGDDVSMEGRGGYTPFVRKRQFAAVEAPSRRHVDLGLRYVRPPESTRLAPAKAPGQSTHKVRLETIDEVDHEVLRLLAAAYEQNG